jgi:hypothetical protein
VRLRALSVAQRYMLAQLADGPKDVPDPNDKWPAYRIRTAESLVARGLAHWVRVPLLARSDVRS